MKPQELQCNEDLLGKTWTQRMEAQAALNLECLYSEALLCRVLDSRLSEQVEPEKDQPVRSQHRAGLCTHGHRFEGQDMDCRSKVGTYTRPDIEHFRRE